MEVGSASGSGLRPLRNDAASRVRRTGRWQNFERVRRSLENVREESGSGGELPARQRKLKEVANKMEGVLLNVMVKQMRDTVHTSELFQGGRAGEIFQERLDRRYAQTMARQHEFGIAEAIYREFSSNLTGG